MGTGIGVIPGAGGVVGDVDGAGVVELVDVPVLDVVGAEEAGAPGAGGAGIALGVLRWL